MSFKRNELHRLVVAVAAVLAFQALASGVSAAPSLGIPKGKPYYGSSNQRTSRSIRHARDYSRDIYRYSRDADQIAPATAKEESEELGRNITKAQKELATAKTEAGNDAATLAALKSIEQHLATAAAQHAMLHEECCKDAVDGGVCMKHCNQILLELDKAQAEHNALMRAMEMGTHSTGGSSTTHDQ